LTQVQLRLPEELVEEIDNWVKSGRFRSRSDAIKSMIEIYNERERTREFLKMLDTRSRAVEYSPEKLIPLEE
jgi:Arc/MetJ-type ribon-helix-helix transcriptional regulator